MTAENIEKPRFMRLDKAATYSGLSVVTLRRWARQGRLKAYKPSSRVMLIDVADLDRLVGGTMLVTPEQPA